ncbi:EbsC protein [Enterococcus saccharolyticus]|uniref:EbsC protein n=1 Tax=Candidatus Enterococcus willemsii TaxID=1857215 RepID=A0ABQ6YVC7_9ENTE|nr:MULTISPECIES: YbaK/EbsC family protein [Enterococcus]KAF1301040.1 EbsC protein [Enterococcus sp. CU12B]MCD5001153.1 EbsC protein [Enterococcus saccharolyticus]
MTDVELYLQEKNIAFQSHYFSANERAQYPIFKTLVLKGDKTGTVIALIPLEARLDYKKMAKASNNRKIGLPPMDYVLQATGYPHGANTPIGIFMTHPEYSIFFDETVNQHKQIIVSAGELEKGIVISPAALQTLIHPVVTDILQ